MLSTPRPLRGFSLIEILITLGVLSTGILALAVLHGVITRQSFDNKARAEALVLAQSRIEELRNYTSEARSLGEFSRLFPDTSGLTNATTLAGINSIFTRSERFSGAAGLRDLLVSVTWADSTGSPHAVQLETTLTFVSPRSIGDTLLESLKPLVDPPSGRARAGEVSLPADARLTPNGDGTALYQDDNMNLMLISGDQIVLTLAQACRTEDGKCRDFTRIKGTVYIDTETQPSLNPATVHVVASDAAFCARYYTKGGTVYPLMSGTTAVMSTANDGYRYFNYTCYLGGGWHGNIGVVLATGIKQTDKVCMGDPLAGNSWEFPIIASRRVYRGMLFKHDSSTASGKEEIRDRQGSNLIRYYSKGIGDSIELPVPGSGQQGHDFVIASLPASAEAESACSTEAILLRPDSALNGGIGDRFAGMPADFVCLNNGLLDIYNQDIYGHNESCPYNPADPPATRRQVTGTLWFIASNTPVHDVLATTIKPHTSDGPGNCLATSFNYKDTKYEASYRCDVYDWGNGWNGYIEVSYDASALYCNPKKMHPGNITRDKGGIDFTNCSLGAFVVFTGTVAGKGPVILDEVRMSTGGSCTTANDGLSYQCVSQAIDDNWSGSLSFTSNNAVICSPPVNDGIFRYSKLATGHYTRNLVIVKNVLDCN